MCIKLGVPMAFLSWLVFTWMHVKGKLDIRGNSKAISAELTRMRKSEKARRAAIKKEKKAAGIKTGGNGFLNFLQAKDSEQDPIEDNTDHIYNRWMWFGGGFYGLAALWTLVVAETLDVLGFIYNFPGISELLAQGIWSLIGDFIANQIMNIVTAFTWFNYWAGSSPVWLSFAVAYAGYWLGMQIAKHQVKD